MKTYCKKCRLRIKKILKKRKQDLKNEYIQADKDPARLQTIKDWEGI
jgi:hypothetical protein